MFPFNLGILVILVIISLVCLLFIKLFLLEKNQMQKQVFQKEI